VNATFRAIDKDNRIGEKFNRAGSTPPAPERQDTGILADELDEMARRRAAEYQSPPPCI